MRVNKIFNKLIFIILCCFLVLPKISAFHLCDDKNCDNSIETEEGKSLKYHDNPTKYPNYLFYCTQPSQPWPHTCSYSTTFSERFSAAISYIIEKERNTSGMTYNGAQKAISKFLLNNWENGHGNNLREDWSLTKEQKEVYDIAKNIFDNKTKIEFEQNSITFNMDGRATVKYKSIPTPFDFYCTVTEGATISINRTEKTITINSNGLDLTQSISLSCRTKYGYKPIYYYKCTGQEIVRKGNEKETQYRYGPQTTIKSTPPSYKISYNANGGVWLNGQPETINLTYGEQFTITNEKVTKEGYDFIGWRVLRSDSRWFYDFTEAGSSYVCEEEICTYGWYGYKYNKDNLKRHNGKKMYASGKTITLKDPWVYLNSLNNDNKKKRRTSFTYTFYAQWKKKPSEKVDLTINKVYIKSDGSYGKVISPATFALYSDSECNNVVKSNIITSNGTKTIEIDKGTYYVKEIQAPNGYKIDNTCRKVEVGEDGAKIDIENETSCSTLLSEINLTYSGEERKKELINLYLEQLNLNKNYNKLLDFENAACEVKSCPNKDVKISCLAVKKFDDSFNENDLSCHDQIVDSNSSVGFCQTFMDINNTLNITTSNYTFTGISGQFLIKQNSGQLRYYNGSNEIIINEDNILTGEIEKVCYLTNLEDYTTNDIGVTIAFGNNDGDKETDILPSTSSELIKTSENKGYLKKILFKKNLSYDLNKVYLERITGRVIDESVTAITSRGLIVPFNGTIGSIPFEINVIDSSGTSFNIKNNESCRYETLPEVIIYPNSKKRLDGTNPGELQIEFRTIDTNKPFNRTPKSNWNTIDAWSLENQNSLIKDYIINSTNSRGIKNNVKQTPKYKIKLTSGDIKIIKKYNEDHPYDDYNFFCKNNICVSKFLTSLKNGENLEEAGTLLNRLIFERSAIADSIFENETEDFGYEEIEEVID